MDVEKIMAEERATAAAERDAVRMTAWAHVLDALESVPGLKFDKRIWRISAPANWMLFEDQIWVKRKDEEPTGFAAKDWEKAVEQFVRNIARTGA